MSDVWMVSGVGINLSGKSCSFQGTIDFDYVVSSGVITSGVPEPPPVGVGYYFDVGVSGVVPPSGFVKLSADKVFASGGYGWLGNNYDSRDRGAPLGAMRDFVFAPDLQLKIDGLVSGNYAVSLSFCDVLAPHDMAVYLQSGFQEVVAVQGGSSPSGIIRNYTVPVVNSLLIGVNGSGGVDPNAVLNAVEVVRG